LTQGSVLRRADLSLFWFDESRDGAVTEYQGYRIEPYEPEPSRWRARISRLDGKELKTAVPPMAQAFLDTTNTMSYGHAVDLAKQAIDGGGID
jgi:hypothetical protein